MYDLFAHAPGWLVLAVFMLVPALVAIALHAIFRRIVPASKLIPHHDVAGFLVAIVGVLYAVVLGFLVISVWSSFDQAQRNADAETNAIADILYLTRALPDPERSRERLLLSAYAREVRDVEWPMLANGEEDLRARAILVAALNVIATSEIPPGTRQTEILRQTSLRDAALSSFREVTAHRRLRLLDARSQVQPTMYVAMIAGGLIVLAFVFLFGVDNFALQAVMTGLVAAMIGLQIGIIFEMDRPFWGAIHVTSDAWSLLIADNHLEAIQDPGSGTP
jgi:hypothetical protein